MRIVNACWKIFRVLSCCLKIRNTLCVAFLRKVIGVLNICGKIGLKNCCSYRVKQSHIYLRLGQTK